MYCKILLSQYCQYCHKVLKVQEENIQEIAEFTYLGSVITKEGGAVADAKTRIRKANAALPNF